MFLRSARRGLGLPLVVGRLPALGVARLPVVGGVRAVPLSTATEAPPQPPAQPEAATGAEKPAVDVAALEAKVAELKDALLRQRAETENVRKMGMERAEDAKKFALQTLIKDLIVVFDTMELALANVKGERDRLAELEDFTSAIRVVEADLFSILRKHGVERYHPEDGHDFSPAHHQALFIVPAPTKEAGNKVTTVVKKGFSLSGRVLRPAHVGVTKHQ